MKDEPTGALMLKRSHIIAEKVEEILPSFRSTSGSYLQLWIRVCQRYYDKQVRIRYDRKTTALSIHFFEFKNQQLVPTPETVRRRAQEIFARENQYILPVSSFLHADDFSRVLISDVVDPILVLERAIICNCSFNIRD